MNKLTISSRINVKITLLIKLNFFNWSIEKLLLGKNTWAIIFPPSIVESTRCKVAPKTLTFLVTALLIEFKPGKLGNKELCKLKVL